MDKKKYIVAAVILIAVVLGGLAYSGFDFSKFTGAMVSVSKGPAPIPKRPILSISAVNVPASDILVTGSSQQLINRYSFKALNDNITVNKLTVINDSKGAFDAPVNTNAVSLVTLKYTDINNVMQAKTASLSNGVATFSQLGLYAPKASSVNVNIYVDVNPMQAIGEELSGKAFRLGIKDTNNTSDTFEAVGVSTAQVINSPSFSGSSSVQEFTVRRSKPTFATAPAPSKLVTGENTLFSFNVTANQAGSVSFGRFVYNVNVSGFSSVGDDIWRWSFYRGSTKMSSDNVNIYCAPANSANVRNLLDYGLDQCDGVMDNGIANGAYNVIVSFNQEETISAGTSNLYILKANITNAGMGKSITTKLATGDDNVAVAGLTANNGNQNTGKISDIGANLALITSGASSFLNSTVTARNIIWSDNSADIHSYPIISSGTVTNGTGSYDWTNGYLLKVAILPAVTLSY